MTMTLCLSVVTVLMITCRCSSFFLFSKSTLQRAIRFPLGRSSAALEMSSIPSQHEKQAASTVSTPARVLCYGDSLTAGTSYPSDRLFPYGPHLERELNDFALTSSPSSSGAAVRWQGLPGWTASAMADCLDDAAVGLRSALHRTRDPPVAVVILLAGTNDIGALTSGARAVAEDVDATSAAEPILRLHRACLDFEGEAGARETRTLAVGVPGSAWQEAQPRAARACADMNAALRAFAAQEERVSFLDFPFPFQRGDVKWCEDGLHLSPEGYATLGRKLAPCVKQILDRKRHLK